MLRLLVSPACVCWGPRASGGSGGCPGGRGPPGTSGRRTSPARGSCGFWRTTGGSRCDTCCTRSWPGRRRASCRNTSPGPRSRHLGGGGGHRVRLGRARRRPSTTRSPSAYLNRPWCPRPLLNRLRLGTPPASPGGTPFGFPESLRPSAPSPRLPRGLGRPSAAAPRWAPPCRGRWGGGAAGGGECWSRPRAPPWLSARWRRRGAAAPGPTAPLQRRAAAPSSSSSSSACQLSCARPCAGWGSSAGDKRGRQSQKSWRRRHEDKDLWEFNSRLFWCGWRAGLPAGDASCSCHGDPWGGAVGRRWGGQGSSHRCQPCCRCCWGGWSCCVTESPGTRNRSREGND